MQLNEALHSSKQTIAQATVVRATGTGGNEVDIAFAHRLAIFGKRNSPTGAFAFCKAVVVAIGKAFAFKQGNDRVSIQGLHEVVAQARLVLPRLRVFGFFVEQSDRHTWHEDGLAAQQMRQLGHWQRTGFKIFGIGPNAHGGALLAIALACFSRHQRLDHIAPRKRQSGHLSFAVAGSLKTLGQGIGHTDAHAMQSTREAVGTALAFVKLAAGMQTREHQFNDRCFFFWMQTKWNAATVIFNADRTVAMQ